MYNLKIQIYKAYPEKKKKKLNQFTNFATYSHICRKKNDDSLRILRSVYKS